MAPRHPFVAAYCQYFEKTNTKMINFTPLVDYFYFTKTERRGALVLLCLAILFFLLPVVSNLMQPIAPAYDFTAFQAQVDAFHAKNQATSTPKKVYVLDYFDPNTVEKPTLLAMGLSEKTASTFLKFRAAGGRFRTANDLLKIYGLTQADFDRIQPFVRMNPSAKEHVVLVSNQSETIPKAPPTQLFAFNPNIASKEDFIKLGISPRLSNTIINYRTKGGVFRKREDLRKIYDFPETTYQRLAPFIDIPEEEKPNTPVADAIQVRSTPETPSIIVDINNSKDIEWQQLRGIGPAYAKRIINFREKLGGFANVDQIAETYGLPDSVFVSLKPHLQVSQIFRKIKINAATVEELKQHPYLKWNQAKVIVNYRRNHGDYVDVSSLAALDPVLRPEDVERLLPYLDFSQAENF